MREIRIGHVFTILVISLSLFCVCACFAFAGSYTVVEPSGKKDVTDAKIIISALDKYDEVKLKEGTTFYLASPIHMKSNKTINATGATVIAENEIIVTDLNCTGYSNVRNVTIKGGTWDCSSSGGYNRSSIVFVHGSNIKLRDMTIRHASYDGHALEIVACKDVLVDNVTIKPRGASRKTEETMVQVDIATDATYPRAKGTKFSNGAVCKNVTISNCDIVGNRAVATGYDYKKQGFINKAHANIKLINNKITSMNAEGVFLPNVKNATVKGNTIISKCKKYSNFKSIGVHYLLAGKVKGATLLCTGNKIKGGLHAVRAHTLTSKKIKKATIKKNNLYCKKGKSKAIRADKKRVLHVVTSGNKKHKW